MSGTRTTWNFYSAGRLIFGRDSVRELGPAAVREGIDSALIVTDPVLVGAGVVETVTNSLRAAGIAFEIFEGGKPEPPISAAEEAVEVARRFGPRAIIGVGGGSNMDLAKITANVFTHGGAPADYFGWDNVPGPTCPIVCVPTTSGTGSEVSHAAVLTDSATDMKVSTLGNHLRPRLAIVDPLLSVSCPPQPTADSGIDALVHAIEAYTATDYTELELPIGAVYPYDGRHPLGDVLAEKAITLVGQHLRTAVREPENLAAREGMSLAATLAGLAFSNCGVAVVHALEYPIGVALHCSHGAGNGLLLPHVMRFNKPTRTPQLARIASLLGEDVTGMPEDVAADRAIEVVQRLSRDIGIPQRIADLGGSESQLPGFAAKAFEVERLMLLNGRRPTLTDLEHILAEAF